MFNDENTFKTRCYINMMIYFTSLYQSKRKINLLIYSFICWWTSRLLPCPGYYKQCCDEHWGTRVSFNFGFLAVYAQQWDCWVVWQIYFQFFKEVSQKEKHQYSILMHIYMEFRKMVTTTLYAIQQKRHRCIEQSFGLCGEGGHDMGEWH